MNQLNATDILHKAAGLLVTRGVGYDNGAERSMARIVKAFNVITNRLGTESALTEIEGWEFMKCLKSVRMFTTDCPSDDTFFDAVAYAALQAESVRIFADDEDGAA